MASNPSLPFSIFFNSCGRGRIWYYHSTMYPSFHNECTPKQKLDLLGAPLVDLSESFVKCTFGYCNPTYDTTLLSMWILVLLVQQIRWESRTHTERRRSAIFSLKLMLKLWVQSIRSWLIWFSLIRASLMRADCAQSATPNLKIMKISLENES